MLNNLGMACTQQQKWSLAEDFLRRSTVLWRQLGEPVSQANAEDNLAEAYLKQRKWEAAQQVLTIALERLSGLEPMGRVKNLLTDLNEHLRMVETALGEGIKV